MTIRSPQQIDRLAISPPYVPRAAAVVWEWRSGSAFLTERLMYERRA
ncbi:hypothetical protein HFO42_03700 [Rhizobium leguminosarum]|uniref:Uncharacterized protein n=1 Tax=Rhizobium leguminosarum TaxID=384 RepID=A0AAJ1EFF5_RHILE|nr:hypothetical protein [Rhizobium leguminosarum]MBY5531977.1 hypothetical protein [Rhizobium leguminosarum]MBY5593281.1 hypothetical protein [Rhizobium leguminosarum]MBY5627249.1 hypothetical protein [Rhizobium leguminosarum]MBY5729547.1 hypothetical protein [Rhizobium leguminosarum]